MINLINSNKAFLNSEALAAGEDQSLIDLNVKNVDEDFLKILGDSLVVEKEEGKFFEANKLLEEAVIEEMEQPTLNSKVSNNIINKSELNELLLKTQGNEVKLHSEEIELFPKNNQKQSTLELKQVLNSLKKPDAKISDSVKSADIEPILMETEGEGLNPVLSKKINENKSIDELLKKQNLTEKVDRAPAIDFEQSDSDLLKLQDFAEQKLKVQKKQTLLNPYKEKVYNSENQEVMNITSVTPEKAAVVPAAYFILDHSNSTKESSPVSQISNQGKVFDMNQLKDNNNLTVDGIIDEIKGYIIQSRASNEPRVDMKFRHEELGEMNIIVNKGLEDKLHIFIGTQDQNAKMFMGAHKDQLSAALSQSGLNITDLKIDISQKFDSSTGFGQSQNFGQKNFNSESNQHSHEQQRRQKLWDYLKEKEVA